MICKFSFYFMTIFIYLFFWTSVDHRTTHIGQTVCMLASQVACEIKICHQKGRSYWQKITLCITTSSCDDVGPTFSQLLIVQITFSMWQIVDVPAYYALRPQYGLDGKIHESCRQNERKAVCWINILVSVQWFSLWDVYRYQPISHSICSLNCNICVALSFEKIQTLFILYVIWENT